MKIDILHATYTAIMIILAFTTALVVTKTIGKYTSNDEKEEEE
jgi:hypothetical protein